MASRMVRRIGFPVRISNSGALPGSVTSAAATLAAPSRTRSRDAKGSSVLIASSIGGNLLATRCPAI